MTRPHCHKTTTECRRHERHVLKRDMHGRSISGTFLEVGIKHVESFTRALRLCPGGGKGICKHLARHPRTSLIARISERMAERFREEHASAAFEGQAGSDSAEERRITWDDEIGVEESDNESDDEASTLWKEGLEMGEQSFEQRLFSSNSKRSASGIARGMVRGAVSQVVKVVDNPFLAWKQARLRLAIFPPKSAPLLLSPAGVDRASSLPSPPLDIQGRKKAVESTSVVHRQRQTSSLDAADEDGNKRLGEELYSPGMNPICKWRRADEEGKNVAGMISVSSTCVGSAEVGPEHGLLPPPPLESTMKIPPFGLNDDEDGDSVEKGDAGSFSHFPAINMPVDTLGRISMPMWLYSSDTSRYTDTDDEDDSDYDANNANTLEGSPPSSPPFCSRDLDDASSASRKARRELKYPIKAGPEPLFALFPAAPPGTPTSMSCNGTPPDLSPLVVAPYAAARTDIKVTGLSWDDGAKASSPPSTCESVAGTDISSRASLTDSSCDEVVTGPGASRDDPDSGGIDSLIASYKDVTKCVGGGSTVLHTFPEAVPGTCAHYFHESYHEMARVSPIPQHESIYDPVLPPFMVPQEEEGVKEAKQDEEEEEEEEEGKEEEKEEEEEEEEQEEEEKEKEEKEKEKEKEEINTAQTQAISSSPSITVPPFMAAATEHEMSAPIMDQVPSSLDLSKQYSNSIFATCAPIMDQVPSYVDLSMQYSRGSLYDLVASRFEFEEAFWQEPKSVPSLLGDVEVEKDLEGGVDDGKEWARDIGEEREQKENVENGDWEGKTAGNRMAELMREARVAETARQAIIRIALEDAAKGTPPNLDTVPGQQQPQQLPGRTSYVALAGFSNVGLADFGRKESRAADPGPFVGSYVGSQADGLCWPRGTERHFTDFELNTWC